MAKLFLTLAIVCFVGAVVGNNFDFDKWDENIIKCGQKLGATEADIRQVLDLEPATSEAGKCLGACILQAHGLMDSSGKYLKSAGEDAIKKIFEGDNEQMKFALDSVNDCADIKVPNNACEAAEAYAKCFREHNSPVFV